MMDNLQKYKPTDKMIDLISDNYSLLQVMSRFGLSLGFGDKTVKEVCELNGVDCRTFLIVVNFMAEGFSRLDGDKDDIRKRESEKQAKHFPAFIDCHKE
jgi:regulator of cell morphogenesis and NO signaling